MKTLPTVVWVAIVLIGTASAATPPITPDPQKTPGATMTVSLKTLCTPGYSSSVRNVPESLKKQVYAAYGITPSNHMATAASGRRVRKSDYEIDHLISLELGGSNDAKNLWPESYITKRYNATVKDGLENRLHWLVCHAGLPVATAQRAIATDWIGAYKHYVVQNATQ